MSTLVDHLVAVTPVGQLVGTAVRYLQEPASTGGDYRGLGQFRWCRPVDLVELVELFRRRVAAPDVAELWYWVHEVVGGPEKAGRVRRPTVASRSYVLCVMNAEGGFM
jgi:hypothetical protein